MWPFHKRSDPTADATAVPTLKGRDHGAQIRELHIRLLDVEGDFDKVLTQLKRFGARLARRDEREPIQTTTENGAEVSGTSRPC